MPAREGHNVPASYLDLFWAISFSALALDSVQVSVLSCMTCCPNPFISQGTCFMEASVAMGLTLSGIVPEPPGPMVRFQAYHGAHEQTHGRGWNPISTDILLMLSGFSAWEYLCSFPVWVLGMWACRPLALQELNASEAGSGSPISLCSGQWPAALLLPWFSTTCTAITCGSHSTRSEQLPIHNHHSPLRLINYVSITCSPVAALVRICQLGLSGTPNSTGTIVL